MVNHARPHTSRFRFIRNHNPSVVRHDLGIRQQHVGLGHERGADLPSLPLAGRERGPPRKRIRVEAQPAAGRVRGSELRRLLERLLHGVANGKIKPRARVLFLFGNPVAIRKGERFIEQDINRLFNGRHELSSGFEALRAAELEQFARVFFSKPERLRLHYDLHTAIRGSKIEQFALYPYKEGRKHSRRELARLAASGLEALLMLS